MAELMQEVAWTDFVISSRFHGVLLPYLLEKPVMALSYDSKIRNLMASVEQDQFCFEIGSFDVEDCKTAFGQMVANRDAVAQRLREQRVSCKEALEAQYEVVFNPG